MKINVIQNQVQEFKSKSVTVEERAHAANFQANYNVKYLQEEVKLLSDSLVSPFQRVRMKIWRMSRGDKDEKEWPSVSLE